jgi:hypothetical protein
MKIFWSMLPIGIELDDNIIVIIVRIFHACGYGAGQTEVGGEVEEGKPVLPAQFDSSIRTAIIDDDKIKLRALPRELLNNRNYTPLFVKGGNHKEDLL